MVVSVTLVTEDQEAVVRAVESFARAAAGLALEGLMVSVTVSTLEDDG
jgi:hypothetical protein